MDVITLTDLLLLFFIFYVTCDNICKIILKIKITFNFNDTEIPEVWNTAKFSAYVNIYTHVLRESVLIMNGVRNKTKNPVILKSIECFFKVGDVCVIHLYV
jgi:hypothetical protein